MKLWNKYLVKRRDGSVPDWPYLVLGAADPYAPAAIREYAAAAQSDGEDIAYVEDLERLAVSFEEWRAQHGAGDPSAPPHRTDDPDTVNQIKAGSTPDGWRTAR
jgi:hypothetical protein